MNQNELPTQPDKKPRWQPLGPTERRIIGVLIEKAKTTPDAYPLSLNALTTGCNQKNNRDPITQLTEDDVHDSLEKLKPIGAVEEVQGSGRVPRFKHRMYEWLGVDKVELAVLAELLLRGAQTEGELRGRAARMAPIADVQALRPLLVSLKAKGLLVSLGSEGRAHIITHALYPPDELEKLRSRHAAGSVEPNELTHSAPRLPSLASSSRTDSVQAELETTRRELADLRQSFDELAEKFRSLENDVHELKQSLGA